jgi:hypothetical protein
MTVKKGGTGKGKPAKSKKQSKMAKNGSATDSNEVSGEGLSLSDQARLNGKYEKFESLEERVKEVERVKRFIVANLGRTALGMMKSAEKGSNAAGAKLLWELAEIDQLPKPSMAQTGTAERGASAAAAPEDTAAISPAEDDDPTKAVLSFYKKLGMTPPELKPPKAVENLDTEAAWPGDVIGGHGRRAAGASAPRAHGGLGVRNETRSVVSENCRPEEEQQVLRGRHGLGSE